MSTAVFEVANAIPQRISELECLLNLADIKKTENIQTYNTLCRASCILLASHLEGFVKEITSNLTTDLNYYLKTFSNMPPAMQRSFCEKIAFYEGIEMKDITQRVNQLQAFFTKNSVQIDMQAFSYKENKNKNPGPDVVEAMFGKIGVPSVLHSISGGKFDNIFKNDLATTYSIRRDICRFRSKLFAFPYAKLPAEYKFNYKNGKDKTPPTLWHTYIEEIMNRRHQIAHGDTMNNVTDITILRQDVEKLDVLMHAVMYSTTSYIVAQKI